MRTIKKWSEQAIQYQEVCDSGYWPGTNTNQHLLSQKQFTLCFKFIKHHVQNSAIQNLKDKGNIIEGSDRNKNNGTSLTTHYAPILAGKDDRLLLHELIVGSLRNISRMMKKQVVYWIVISCYKWRDLYVVWTVSDKIDGH